MTFNRRKFLSLAAGGVAASIWPLPRSAGKVSQRQFEVIAFDAFSIFDPRPIFQLAEAVFPGKGTDLSNAWRTRQFEYQWLRSLSGSYADFWQTTEDALVFSANLLRLDLPPEKRAQLMDAFLHLKAWPDVAAVLRALKQTGVRLTLLSNMTMKMLEAGIKEAGLEGFFAQILSTDRIHTYKPAPRAYQMALDAFEVKRAEILFVPFAGWDAAGAKWFGYPTFWVNRLGLPQEELGAAPDGVGRDLTDLTRFAQAPQFRRE